jgi:hypothetical protein
MIWLLDLTWAGRVFRFASEPVTLVDADGVSLPYAGGLDPSYTVGAAIGEVQADLEVELGEVLFPVDAALWHRSGRPLLGCPATLSTWVSGASETRRARLSGVVSVAEVGALGEPVRLVLRWSAPDGARVVPTAAAVNVDTSNLADPGVYGTPYPRVFGSPGLGLSTTGLDIFATGGTVLPVLDQAGRVLLLADGPVAGTSCTVIRIKNDGTATAETAVPITATTDGLGRTISVATTTTAITDGHTHWVDWTTTTGGTLRRDSSSPILTFGDLLYWLVGESSTTFDPTAWRDVIAQLSAYRVGYYVDDDSSPLDIIKDVLLPILPLSVVPGPNGLRPVFWGLSSTDASAHLVEGENASRVSRAKLDAGEVFNDVTLRYAPRADDGTHARVAVGTEDTHAACAASVTYLPRSALVVETVAVYDSATADRIVGDLVSAYALPVERINYRDLGGLDLDVGQVIALTDSGLHLTARIALVEAVAYSGGDVEYSLALYTVPGRDTLAT